MEQNKPPLACAEACPYLVQAQTDLETAAGAAADPFGALAMGGPGFGYGYREWRARNCEGPMPLPPEGEIVWCSLKKRGLNRDGTPAGRDVELPKLDYVEQVRIRDPHRWQELYDEYRNSLYESYRQGLDSLRDGTYTAAEKEFVTALGNEQLDELYGADIYMSDPDNPSPAAREYQRYHDLLAHLHTEAKVKQYEEEGLTRADAIARYVDEFSDGIRVVASNRLAAEHGF